MNKLDVREVCLLLILVADSKSNYDYALNESGIDVSKLRADYEASIMLAFQRFGNAYKSERDIRNTAMLAVDRLPDKERKEMESIILPHLDS